MMRGIRSIKERLEQENGKTTCGDITCMKPIPKNIENMVIQGDDISFYCEDCRKYHNYKNAIEHMDELIEKSDRSDSESDRDKFKRIRKQKGWSLKEIAKRWGFSYRRVCQISVKPSPLHIDALNGLPNKLES
jgi:hypothetical protein